MGKLYQWILRCLRKRCRQNNLFYCKYDPAEFGEVYGGI